MSAHLDLLVFVGVVLAIVGVSAFLRMRGGGAPGDDPSAVKDLQTENAAKARLSTLTGVQFEDSAEDLEEARPPAPPADAAGVAAAMSTTSGPAQAAEGAVLTQYTSGDGQGVEEMEKMLRKDPDNLQLLDWLAFMYYSNNETEKAIETYSRIIAIAPDNASHHYYLANSFYKANRIEEALRHWHKVCELKPSGKLARKATDRIKKVEDALG